MEELPRYEQKMHNIEDIGIITEECLPASSLSIASCLNKYCDCFSYTDTLNARIRHIIT